MPCAMRLPMGECMFSASSRRRGFITVLECLDAAPLPLGIPVIPEASPGRFVEP
jgi:hypothetical protein